MKKYLKISLLPIISVLFLTFILSFINLFNIEIYPLIYIILTVAIMFIYGYFISNISLEKGYIKSLISSLILVILFFLLSLLLKYDLSLYMIIYYLILVISSSLGGFAANLKKNN